MVAREGDWYREIGERPEAGRTAAPLRPDARTPKPEARCAKLHAGAFRYQFHAPRTIPHGGLGGAPSAAHRRPTGISAGRFPREETDPMTEPAVAEEFARLFAENRNRLFRYIRALVPHRTDAEDVFQDAAVVLWREFPSFRRGADFLPWALAIAFNQVRSHRHRRRQTRLFFSEALLETLAAEGAAMAGELDARGELLQECCGRLGRRDRELVTRYYRSESTVGALARELRRPENTIYKALQRIRRALRECVERRLAAESR